MDLLKVESLTQLFHLMVKEEASDLHLQVGAPPVLRINGETVYMSQYEMLIPDLMNKIIFENLTEKQKHQLDDKGSVDLALGISGLARFRLNVFRQRSSLGLVARIVPMQIKSSGELNLPPTISEFAKYKDGLVIIAGATGSGKSTTLAAIIEQINQNRPCHIISIEDPIEFLYRNKKAYINQREVGIDVSTFRDALRTVLRQDPNIILLGEMRDMETVEFALSAAETGHLVFATLHSSNVSQTISRMLDMFEPEKHHQIRLSLYFNLRGIVCQRLIPAIDPNLSRVPAVEIMLNNHSVKKLIKDGEDAKIHIVLNSCEREGMQTFNKSLLDLVKKNLITEDVAFKFSPNAEELKMNLQGIFLSKTGLIGG